MRRFSFLLTLFLEGLLTSQARPLRIVPELFLPADVQPPRLVHRTEPYYSTYARSYRIQADVVLLATINVEGEATDVITLGPNGFGFDENAIACVKTWKFEPALKDGRPVAARILLTVKFRLPRQYFDEKRERRRSEFNVATWILRRSGSPLDQLMLDRAVTDRAVETVREQAKQRVPPALFLAGLWEVGFLRPGGQGLPPNPDAGTAKIEKAAKAYYSPAIYWLARQKLMTQSNGQADKEEWDTMRQAAMLGNADAQLVLGEGHEKGAGMDQDAGRARNYYRLCASRGVAICQYRLGKILYDAEFRTDTDYEQAMAWLSLATDRDVAAAGEIYNREKFRFTLSQESRIYTLKRQFMGKFD